MRLLNILWRQKAKILIVVLAFLISFLTIAPILKGGLDKVFYTIDPDVVYAANAFLYIKNGYVSYFDHPGTPAIILISFFLAPIRIYAKYIQHTPFINWVFNHYALTFLYLRIWQSVLLFASLTIVSISMWLMTKKPLPVILLFLALLSFGPFYYLGSVISADTFAFFITSIWLLILSFYLNRRNDIFLFALSFIVGFSFAGRATNFFLMPATLVIIFLEKSKILQKVLKTLLAIVTISAGFVIGISPTRTHISTVLNTIFGFAGTTGAHMSGEKTFFNAQAFINSAGTFFYRDTLATAIVIISAIFALIYLFKKEYLHEKIAVITLIFSLGAIIFAKFPLSHYQIANYLIIAFCGSILFSRLSKITVYLTIIVLLLSMIPITKGYLEGVTQSLNRSGYLEQFVTDNPPKYASVWEGERVKEFAYLWNRNYADGMFDDELGNLPQKIYELKSNLTEIGVSKYTDVDLFSVCWDELYVQKTSLESLLKLYPELGKSVQQISDTGVLLVRSDHCQTITHEIY